MVFSAGYQGFPTMILLAFPPNLFICAFCKLLWAQTIIFYVVPYSDVMKSNKEFISKVKDLKNVEEEIIAYLKKNINTGEWLDEHFWIRAAITHPSEKYLDYYLKMTHINDKKVPHWRTLDALAYMPKSLNPKIAEGIKECIQWDNPSWSEEDLKKAFEVLTWIGEEEKITILSREQHGREEVLLVDYPVTYHEVSL